MSKAKHEKAFQTPCPLCLVGPGVKCKARSGRDAYVLHGERFRAMKGLDPLLHTPRVVIKAHHGG